jgi:transcriptional regulator with XRE-family HTH domain
MPLNIRVRFGRAVRRIREDQGINQEEAAERCGLHRTYYSQQHQSASHANYSKTVSERLFCLVVSFVVWQE